MHFLSAHVRMRTAIWLVNAFPFCRTVLVKSIALLNVEQEIVS